MQQWLLFSTRTWVETGRSCISCVALLSSQWSSSSSSLPAITLKSRTQLQTRCQETSLISSVLFTLRPTMPPLQSQQPSWIFSCCPNQTRHLGVGQSCGMVLLTGPSPFNPEDLWFSPEAVSSFLFTSSELVLCRFAAHLAVSGLRASTIKCYLNFFSCENRTFTFLLMEATACCRFYYWSEVQVTRKTIFA